MQKPKIIKEGKIMELKVFLQTNPWINAGIASFYEFHTFMKDAGIYQNPKVEVETLPDGILVAGKEVDIIEHFHTLMNKFLPNHLYKPQAHRTEYIAFDGEQMQRMKGPSRFVYAEILRIGAKKPTESIPLNKLRKSHQNRFVDLQNQIRKGFSGKASERKVMEKNISQVIDVRIAGHPRIKVNYRLKNLKSGNRWCSLCGGMYHDLVEPSGNIFPLFYGQGNYTFDPGCKARKQICYLCEYFSIFSLYTLMYNSSHRGNLRTVNCFIPVARDLRSAITFIRAFREIRMEDTWGNFRTDMSWVNRINESYLALMHEVTKHLKTLPDEDLEALELSQPELFYLKLEQTGQNPSIKDAGIIQKVNYIIELFRRGEAQGVNYQQVLRSLLPKDDKGNIEVIGGNVQTFLRDSIARKIANLEPILLDFEPLVSEDNDNYPLIKSLKFYLKEVMTMSYDVELTEGIGKTIGRGAAADKARMKVIHDIRGAGSYDQLLTALMKVQGRLAGKKLKWTEGGSDREKEIEFFKLNDFVKQITPKNWREIRACLVMFATQEFQYRTKKAKSKEESND